MLLYKCFIIVVINLIEVHIEMFLFTQFIQFDILMARGPDSS